MKRKIKKHLLNEMDSMFSCYKCGPFVEVWLEKWPVGGEGPVKIGLVHHEKNIARVVKTIDLSPNLDMECVDYSFCANCLSMIPKPIPVSTYTKETIGEFENYEVNLDKEKENEN